MIIGEPGLKPRSFLVSGRCSSVVEHMLHIYETWIKTLVPKVKQKFPVVESWSDSTEVGHLFALHTAHPGLIPGCCWVWPKTKRISCWYSSKYFKDLMLFFQEYFVIIYYFRRWNIATV